MNLIDVTSQTITGGCKGAAGGGAGIVDLRAASDSLKTDSCLPKTDHLWKKMRIHQQNHPVFAAAAGTTGILLFRPTRLSIGGT